MPNRIIPEHWIYDVELSKLQRDAQLFFFRLAISVDDYWRCFVGPSPQEPLYLRSTLYPLNPEVRVADVARWLHACEQAGAILTRDSERGWFVEVSERMRYRREDYAERQPKFGPRLPTPPAQQELPLGPVPLKSPPLPRKGQKDASRFKGVGGESVDVVETESRASARKDSGAVARKESDRFARDEESVDDPLWGDLCRTVGLLEMSSNGAAWERRLKLNRNALRTALMDWNAKTPQERNEGGGNAAAYIVAAFDCEVRRVG